MKTLIRSKPFWLSFRLPNAFFLAVLKYKNKTKTKCCVGAYHRLHTKIYFFSQNNTQSTEWNLMTFRFVVQLDQLNKFDQVVWILSLFKRHWKNTLYLKKKKPDIQIEVHGDPEKYSWIHNVNIKHLMSWYYVTYYTYSIMNL